MPSPSFTYVSIPRGLPAQWGKLVRKDRITVEVFYHLKGVRVGGILLDYYKQLPTIAASFGYSVRKLREYIGRMRRKGWAQVHKGHLSLIATRRLGELIGCAGTRTHRVSLQELADIRQVIEARVVENNLRQQAHRVQGKLVDQAIRVSVGIPNPETLTASSRRRYGRQLVGDPTKARHRATQRYERDLAWSTTPCTPATLNPDVTLSRRGLARLFGCRSSATGQRIAKRLEKAGMLRDESRLLYLGGSYIGGIPYEEYQYLRATVLDYNPNYRFIPLRDGSGQGVVARRLPNLLTPLLTN